MNNYSVFLKKEIIESIKTFKLFIMVGVLLILGVLAPLTAYYMPVIMEMAMDSDPSMAGMDLSVLMEQPFAYDSWVQFFGSYIGQMGIFALVIVFSNMLSSEFSRGTLTIILSKGLSRSTVILAKLTNSLMVWTISYIAATLIAWGFTVYFFPGDIVPNLFLAIFSMWLFGVFLLAMTVLTATLTKRGFICMLVLGASAVVFLLLNLSPQIAKYNPASLASLPLRLIAGTASFRHVLPPLILALVGIALFTALAIVIFRKRKKSMIKKIIILVGAAALCIVVTVFFGEEMPRRISVNSRVITENVIIGEGSQWELHGRLTIPRRTNGTVPAVVLVHGSGPNDMDESIFDNKPFRDIAEHLSSNGIAVIRYNKRTLTHGLRLTEVDMRSFTVWEETIEDAILATEMLKADPRIDSDRVYILGHSLGGMLAPRIHEMGGDFAGLILFAGSPRFLLDISRDQVTALADVTEDADERAMILEMHRQMMEEFEFILTLSDEKVQNTHFEHMENMGFYWKDLYDNPIPEFLERVTVPILVMQPDDDVQVLTDVDFAMYKELLAGRTNVTFKLYPGLNHLFMPSRGKNISEIMDEYRIRSRVDRQVLRDLTDWINLDK